VNKTNKTKTRQRKPPTDTIWGRLTLPEIERLQQIALTEDRTQSALVSRAVRQFLASFQPSNSTAEGK
jgi:hypothetical protein